MNNSDILLISQQLANAYISRRRPKSYTEGQSRILQHIQSSTSLVKKHQDLDLQDYVRGLIPVDQLHSEANAMSLGKEGLDADFYFNLIKALLGWFKTKFFTWVNAPSCEICNLETQHMGMTPATSLESSHGAGRVELYSCPNHHQNRFPRYNDPKILFSTRSGRCGEWANAFSVVCRAMGFNTRYILDFTDHVWTEVYIESISRWIHCDSCEGAGACDTPLLYEHGWGKKLSYVFGFGDEGVKDVTERYTTHFDDVLTRRDLASEEWVHSTLLAATFGTRRQFTMEMMKELEERDKVEDLEMTRNRESVIVPLPPRQSGSIDWRMARGEMGE